MVAGECAAVNSPENSRPASIPPPPSPKKERNNRIRGPESAFYDKLKGQQCNLWLHGEELPECVTLLWVDVYTIGIRAQTGREQLVYKKFIRRIERDENGDVGKGSSKVDLSVVG